MSRPTLFVALKGPLLIPGDHSAHPYLGATIAEYAKPFLGWAKAHFNVQVLTDESPRHVHVLLDELGLNHDHITPRGFEVNKTECMEPRGDFYWVDSELIPGEVAWLAQHDHYHRLLAADPEVGVTSKHKDALEAFIRIDQTRKRRTNG